MSAEEPDVQDADQDTFSGSFERQESVATTEARLRMEGVELKEEWQDEDFPRPLPEDDHIEGDFLSGADGRPAWAFPVLDQSMYCTPYSASHNSRKYLPPSYICMLSICPSVPAVLRAICDDLPKPKPADVLPKGSIPEYSAAEEKEESRRWRMFRIGEQDHRVDMSAIEPYKKVISHGGYYGDGLNAIIVFAVCFMPDSSQPNYRYLMDNLFKYVIGTLEMLVAENYMIVYLNGATTRRKMPSLGWLRKCYQQIDRRLRKNLKSLIIVHPSWFIRTLLAITKPFISSKFSQKIKYVFSLVELAELIPMEYVVIPECIKEYDDAKSKKKHKSVDKELHKKTEDQTNEQ
ncbi:BCL2/adenovirus E1B 19 kDa protein-interacting protein 2 [Anomaloglossus baeobatrachus]|uniref:BCL2/adenovirus E1B 19 kDa protein-interacting protein 2 n=1 Tax=Anomaloglossus baeobatrachus TaxID=238106 RepID=UPI003F50166C